MWVLRGMERRKKKGKEKMVIWRVRRRVDEGWRLWLRLLLVVVGDPRPAVLVLLERTFLGR